MLGVLSKSVRALDARVFGKCADHYEHALEREIVGSCQSLLDLGCGSQSPVERFSRSLRYTVGVDAHEPAVEQSRQRGIHTVCRRMDVMTVADVFPARSFDCVLAADLIEHLPKEDALRLIRMMESVAAKKVVIFTPNGFLPQSPYNGNELQRHLSGWTVRDMRELGYRVRGIRGLRWIRKSDGSLPRPAALWRRLVLLTQPICEAWPNLAFQLLCTKELDRDARLSAGA